MNWRSSFGVVLAACLVGCGGTKTSREDVQSAVSKSLSLASEAETFVEYLAQGRPTRAFAAGHLSYMQEEVNRTLQDISHLHPDVGLMKSLNVETVQLRSLSEQLHQVSQHMEQPNALDIDRSCCGCGVSADDSDQRRTPVESTQDCSK
jgi:hypothetical protein